MDRKTRNILLLLCFGLVFFLTAAPVMIIRGPVIAPSSGCTATSPLMFKWPNPSSTDITASGGCSAGDSTGTANGDVSISGGAVVVDDTTSQDGYDYYAFDVSSEDIFNTDVGTVFIRFEINTWVNYTRLLWVEEAGGYVNDLFQIQLANNQNLRVYREGNGTGRDGLLTGNNVSTNTVYWVRASWRNTSTPYLKIELYSDNNGSMGSLLDSGSDSNSTIAWQDLPGNNSFRVGNGYLTAGAKFKIYYIAVYDDWRSTEP